MEKRDAGSALLLLLVLAFAVVIVDERWLRVLIAVVPALLLAQRAMLAEGGEESRVGGVERRADPSTRGSIDDLLRHIREFYLTCHLLGTGKIDSNEAAEMITRKEMELNRLLASVTDSARSGAEGGDL